MVRGKKFEKEFEKLFLGNYSRLYYFAYNFLNDAETSKNIVNDAFVYLWENFGKLENVSPGAVLFRVVRNKCIDYLRHSKVRKNYATIYSSLYSEGYEYEDISIFEEDERLVKVNKVLDALPPRTRYILEECYFNEKKYSEVAEILNISASAVKKHIIKALRMLREEFHIENRKVEMVINKDKDSSKKAKVLDRKTEVLKIKTQAVPENKSKSQ